MNRLFKGSDFLAFAPLLALSYSAVIGFVCVSHKQLQTECSNQVKEMGSQKVRK